SGTEESVAESRCRRVVQTVSDSGRRRQQADRGSAREHQGAAGSESDRAPGLAESDDAPDRTDARSVRSLAGVDERYGQNAAFGDGAEADRARSEGDRKSV